MNRKARAAATLIAAALVLLASACSSSSSSGSGGSPNAAGPASFQSAVAYSRCIRFHGVPNFPDPSSNGEVPETSAQLLRVSGSQLQAARIACQRLYPSNCGVLNKDSLAQCEETGDCPRALVQETVTAMLRYARCMRSHEVPNWPDPTVDSEGRPGFNLVPIHGTDWNSPQISTEMQDCEHVMPGGAPVPAIAPGGPG
jgi:hypothetical protein